MSYVGRTVTDSQVFNWVEVLKQHGVNTDLISLSNKQKMQNKDAVNQIEKKTGGKFYQYKLYPPIINDLVLFFIFLKLYLSDYSKYDRIIFQTRLEGVGIPFFIIRLLPKVKTIFESRGATIEERKYEHGKPLSIKAVIKEHLNYFSEKLLTIKSDGIICVSNALSEYYATKFNIGKERKRNRFLVIPGAASVNLFYLNKKLRENTRRELKYGPTDLVIVYSGALIQKWEIPDDVFSFVKKLKTKQKNIVFLVITPDVELAKDYSAKYEMKEFTTILNSSFDEVNKFLNASDIAILIREDTLMNNVASPTKFAEYLMCGLPTIISKGVYDFADTIHTTNYGIVLEDYQHINDQEFNRIYNLKDLNRESIALWAKANLSKEKFVSQYTKFFDEI